MSGVDGWSGAFVGIVGSEAAKFTVVTENAARKLIRELLQRKCDDVTVDQVIVVSGGCHLGGVDAFAVEEASDMGLGYSEFLPKVQSWDAGYRPRNIRIAKTSTEVHCITVQELPLHYRGLEFSHCYHCNSQDHVKSGGCWTVKYAREKLGKVGHVHVIRPDGRVRQES